EIDAELPASLSPAWNGILRRELGFDGILMTDDIEMHALDRWSPEEKTVRFLAAESDILLVCSGTEEVMRAHWEALVHAAERGTATRRRLEKVGERVDGEIFSLLGPR
ncbi:MAG TPA: glycoside hydrolase family 3 N-terminal domain-containing protein, partial [bacterium]|nr:glycoside hydrolase family 3 N-terminal domain-containing protein [bacterium]